MKESIIITGATSSIGVALIDLLQKKGLDVTAVIKPNSVRGITLRRLYPKLEILECPLADLDRVALPGKKYEALFHIGWNSEFLNARYNLEGQMQNANDCLKAVEMAHRYQCEAFLSIGSQAECGRVHSPIDSGTPDHPETAYARAKCIAYEKTADLCRRYGMRQYWPRLLSAYGPYDKKTTLVMSCIHACRERKQLSLTSAEQVWDYIYVKDVAEALFSIWKYGIPEKRYAVASGKGRELKEYIAEIAKETNYWQILEGIGKKEYADRQVMYLVGNIGELTEDTGFIPGWDFAGGIREIVKILEDETR